MKTNYKKIEKYIIASLDRENLAECADNDCMNDFDAFNALKSRFVSEYGHELNRKKSGQTVFSDWLQGLPSTVNMAFYNCEIIDLAHEWGSLPAVASEREEDEILENYWYFMAMQYRKAARKFGIDLF